MANDDDLRRYVSLKESLRAIQQELKTIEPRILARAARQPDGGVLFSLRGRELHARPRMFPLWRDRKARDDILHELDMWDKSSAYSWNRFRTVYQTEPGLRKILGDAVTEELRFTLTIRQAP